MREDDGNKVRVLPQECYLSFDEIVMASNRRTPRSPCLIANTDLKLILPPKTKKIILEEKRKKIRKIIA